MNEDESIMKPRRIFYTLLALLPWLPRIALAELPAVPPVQFPFNTSRVGSHLDREIRILEYRTYYFDLWFDYAGSDDLYRVQKLTGSGARGPDGRYATPGAIVPVRVKIIKADAPFDAEPLFDQAVETQGIYAQGFTSQKFHGNFRRRVATVQLKPGLYRFQADTLQDVPEFAGIPSHFVITIHSKVLPLKE